MIFQDWSGFIFPVTGSGRREESRRRRVEMARTPMKMKAVVYALSPFQQKVMSGLWNDWHNKLTHKVTDNWLNAALLLGPLVAVHTYVDNYKEKEKLAHRY